MHVTERHNPFLPSAMMMWLILPTFKQQLCSSNSVNCNQAPLDSRHHTVSTSRYDSHGGSAGEVRLERFGWGGSAGGSAGEVRLGRFGWGGSAGEVRLERFGWGGSAGVGHRQYSSNTQNNFITRRRYPITLHCRYTVTHTAASLLCYTRCVSY